MKNIGTTVAIGLCNLGTIMVTKGKKKDRKAELELNRAFRGHRFYVDLLKTNTFEQLEKLMEDKPDYMVVIDHSDLNTSIVPYDVFSRLHAMCYIFAERRKNGIAIRNAKCRGNISNVSQLLAPNQQVYS